MREFQFFESIIEKISLDDKDKMMIQLSHTFELEKLQLQQQSCYLLDSKLGKPEPSKTGRIEKLHRFI
jgi:hypothetical protein